MTALKHCSVALFLLVGEFFGKIDTSRPFPL